MQDLIDVVTAVLRPNASVDQYAWQSLEQRVVAFRRASARPARGSRRRSGGGGNEANAANIEPQEGIGDPAGPLEAAPSAAFEAADSASEAVQTIRKQHRKITGQRRRINKLTKLLAQKNRRFKQQSRTLAAERAKLASANEALTKMSFTKDPRRNKMMARVRAHMSVRGGYRLGVKRNICHVGARALIAITESRSKKDSVYRWEHLLAANIIAESMQWYAHHYNYLVYVKSCVAARHAAAASAEGGESRDDRSDQVDGASVSDGSVDSTVAAMVAAGGGKIASNDWTWQINVLAADASNTPCAKGCKADVCKISTRFNYSVDVPDYDVSAVQPVGIDMSDVCCCFGDHAEATEAGGDDELDNGAATPGRGSDHSDPGDSDDDEPLFVPTTFTHIAWADLLPA